MTDLLRSDTHEWARDEAIRAFLKSRPDFVLGDAELMDALGVRPHAANVIEFGPEALSRVARAHREEAGVRRQLERVAEANFEAQSRTHEAVIEVIAARSHTDLARRLDELARGHFGLAAAVMALEGPERSPAGWRPLVEGQADLILGRGRAARLGVVPTAHGLFGAAAADLGSVALVRLSLWAPARTGVLAFGAKSEDTFAADMGHELLDFLARVVERTAERWPLP
ncbi:MAG TPA: DUF484 family protein [Caulobacteraceae bacterium]|jgi:hypothetical protein